MLTGLFSRIVVIVYGVLNPSYRTYKAIRRKDYQEVVTLGMYWVVLGIFITIEFITDIFLQWFPFYHEIKLLFVIWLASPVTSGYSWIYRKLIHPELAKRENEIDEAISRATERGYTKAFEFGAKGLNYAAKTVLTTAMKGQDLLADHFRRRSASMFELNQPQPGLVQRHLKSRLDAGDNHDFTDSDFFRPSSYGNQLADDDPFSLNWLQMGSTGSLGRHWKPLYTGLSGVPEDVEQSADFSQPHTTKPVQNKRGSNVTQTFSLPSTHRISTRNSVRQNSTKPPTKTSAVNGATTN